MVQKPSVCGTTIVLSYYRTIVLNMPRKKRKGLVRKIAPDLKYNDGMVAKMINKIMQAGKKGVSERIVYGAFQIIQEKKKEEPLSVFKKALENLKPQMEVRSRRVGGANYQVPVEVRSERKLALSLKWLIDAAKERSEKTMRERLALEILEVLDKKGGAMRKKEETHKMAEANRAFAHYKW